MVRIGELPARQYGTIHPIFNRRVYFQLLTFELGSKEVYYCPRRQLVRLAIGRRVVNLDKE